MDGETGDSEPEAMSSGEIFVIFVIPAAGVILAYAAMRANEWALARARERGE